VNVTVARQNFWDNEQAHLPLSPEDRLADRDPQLDKAIELLKQ
jgi:hypothetical protein